VNSPHYRGKRRSRDIPTGIKAAYLRALRDPGLLSLQTDAAIIEAPALPMAQICSRCAGANPDEAAYCHRDGFPLSGVPVAKPPGSGARPFPSPLVFASGQACYNFDQLARACEDDWSAGAAALRSGLLAAFFRHIGRNDLAQAARGAADGPDIDLGLNDLLGAPPGLAAAPPQLRLLSPSEVDLPIRVREGPSFDLRLGNRGGRLLCGSVRADSPWLALAEEGPATRKAFKFRRDWMIRVHVRGRLLGACSRPFDGRLEVSSNGGDAAVVVRVWVAARPFPYGPLAGAAAPRDLVARVRRAPQQAAPWFENGSVEAWYRANGWPYPVTAPPASGLDAVRRFFHALGLPDRFDDPPAAPPVRAAIALHGAVGQEVMHRLTAKPRGHDARPLSARATSDQTWLDGASASILLVVPEVPNRPSETLHARVNLTLNDLYQTVVLVSLSVAAAGETPPARGGGRA
jgi:hypothetical protein